MAIQVREIVIKAIVGQPEKGGEKNTPSTTVKRSRGAQMNVSMVEEILKSKKER